MMSHTIKNLVLFKIGWAACVFGAAYNLAWIGIAAVIAIVVEHLRTAIQPQRELWLIAMAALIGIAWESFVVSAGLIAFNGSLINAGLAPLWIVAMWMLFATTLNVGMRWMKSAWWVGALAGLIGGPMAFYIGAELGAVTFESLAMSLTVIGLGWAMLMPLLIWAADLFDGYTESGRVAV